MRIVILSLILILSLSACEPVGDFCDLALDLRTTHDLSALIFDTDESFARDLAVHNTMYQDCT